MNTADIMTRDPVIVRSGARLAEVVHLMLEHHVSGIPVVAGNGELVGIVTEGDLLRRAETATDRRRPRWLELVMGPGRLAKDYVHAHSRKVEDVMTRDVVSVTPDALLSDAVALMERHHIKRLPLSRRAKNRTQAIRQRDTLPLRHGVVRCNMQEGGD